MHARGPAALSLIGGYMKLFSLPGACSTADHIALQWAGQPFEVEVMTREGLGSPAFLAINPARSIPVIVDGEYVLTQNTAILTYIAETYPQAQLFGDGSPRQRAEAMRWQAFGNADLHPIFGAFFAPTIFLSDPAQHDALQAAARVRLRGLFERADAQLEGKSWIAGFRSIADPYLYIMLRWAGMFAIDLDGLTHLAAFKRRMESDAGVRAALEAEGLSPALPRL